LRTSVLVIAGALAVSFYAATFTVHQTQQALVLQFGRVRDVINEPGLHFKWPFIEGVVTIGCSHVRRSPKSRAWRPR
jgi:membrane protease subunit HflC